MFKKINANPKNKKTSDCVVRAFVHATGNTWESVLTDLFNLSLKTGLMVNDIEIVKIYAESIGMIQNKIQLTNGHKPTVKSFANDNPKGIYILRVANHIVCVVDGDYIDSWDSGNKSVYKYWSL